MEILHTPIPDRLETFAPELGGDKKARVKELMGDEDNWYELTIRHGEYMSLGYQLANPDKRPYSELVEIKDEWDARLYLLRKRDKSIDLTFVWEIAFWEVMRQIGEEETIEISTEQE